MPLKGAKMCHMVGSICLSHWKPIFRCTWVKVGWAVATSHQGLVRFCNRLIIIWSYKFLSTCPFPPIFTDKFHPWVAISSILKNSSTAIIRVRAISTSFQKKSSGIIKNFIVLSSGWDLFLYFKAWWQMLWSRWEGASLRCS